MNEEAPSWVVAPAPPRADGPAPAVPVRLRLLVVVVAVLGVAEAVHVAGRDELVTGFRAGLVLVVLLQVPLAVLAARRSAAAACGLFVYLGTAAIAAATGGFGDRLGITAGAALAAFLLATSLDAFPAPQLPPSRSQEPPDAP